MSGCIDVSSGGGGRKGPIPAVAIKETKDPNDQMPNGQLANAGQNLANGCDDLSRLRLTDDEPSVVTSAATKSRTPCCGGHGEKSSESRQRVNEIKSCDQIIPPEHSSIQPPPTSDSATSDSSSGVTYHIYENELNMPDIMRLIQKDLSEPYSIYTYRYFIHNWPNLCFMARVGEECVGAIVCKLDYHKKVTKRGYIAMLAVDSKFRKRAIGSTLVQKAIEAMNAQEADEVVLETEITNRPALRLYENLGFVRDKRLFRYYLNGVDALRLKLWLR